MKSNGDCVMKYKNERRIVKKELKRNRSKTTINIYRPPAASN